VAEMLIPACRLVVLAIYSGLTMVQGVPETEKAQEEGSSGSC
jgi:hypothetical protein